MMKINLRIIGVLISTALLTMFLTACGSGGGGGDNNDNGGGQSLKFTIPTAAIIIDGNIDDWNNIEPVFVDDVNDQDPDADFDGTDLHKFYLAKDDTFLYVAMTLYDGNPKVDIHTQYGFQAQQEQSHESTGDHMAKAGFSSGEWYSAVYIRNHSDIANYPSEYVGVGQKFIEWKVLLSDMWILNERFVYVYIHTFDGPIWYDVSDSANFNIQLKTE